MADAPKGKPPATYEDYVRHRDEGRPVELIDGQLVETAMPSPEHGSAQTKLAEVLGPFHRRSGGPRGPGGWWLMTEVDVRYVQSRQVFRHDAIGFRRDTHPTRPTGMPVETKPEGALRRPSTQARERAGGARHAAQGYTLAPRQRGADGYQIVSTRVERPASDVERKAAQGRRLRRRIGVRLCYDARMKKRPGGTTHLSISLPAEQAKILKRRAKRVYDGNVSRVVSDAIRYIAYEEGRDALIASFGGKGKPTPAEAAQLDAAWGLVAKKSA